MTTSDFRAAQSRKLLLVSKVVCSLKLKCMTFLFSISQNFLCISLNGLTSGASFPAVGCIQRIQFSQVPGRGMENGGQVSLSDLISENKTRKNYCDHLSKPFSQFLQCTLYVSHIYSTQFEIMLFTTQQYMLNRSQHEEITICINNGTGHRHDLNH